MTFENKLTHNGIHYSRYIASWVKILRRNHMRPWFGSLFEQWLRETQGLNDDEVAEIILLAGNGKLELEESVQRFIDEKHDSPYLNKN